MNRRVISSLALIACLAGAGHAWSQTSAAAPAATTTAPAAQAPTAAAPAATPAPAASKPAAAKPAAAKTPAAKQLPKGYTYAHPDAEYSITLPEAPVAITIWGDNPDMPVPLLDNPPKFGAVGETATFKRVDIETGDVFEVTIVLVKADREFLSSVTRKKIEEYLEAQMSNQQLDGKKQSFSAGTGTLKWGTLSGFSVDNNNALFYNIMHYITGVDSVMTVKVKYNVENKTFQQYYEDLSGSIKYTGK